MELGVLEEKEDVNDAADRGTLGRSEQGSRRKLILKENTDCGGRIKDRTENRGKYCGWNGLHGNGSCKYIIASPP